MGIVYSFVKLMYSEISVNRFIQKQRSNHRNNSHNINPIRCARYIFPSGYPDSDKYNPEQFEILINALLHTVSDLTELINSDINSLNGIVEIGKKMGYVEADIKNKINIAKEKEAEYYERAKVVYTILLQINTPYEGAIYMNEHGEIVNIESFKKSPDYKYTIN